MKGAGGGDVECTFTLSPYPSRAVWHHSDIMQVYTRYYRILDGHMKRFPPPELRAEKLLLANTYLLPSLSSLSVRHQAS